jgi:hypothetical protein
LCFGLVDGGGFFVGVDCAGVGMAVGVDGGEAVEEQATDVGESAGAAGGDFATGEEMVKGGEGVVDALGVEELATCTRVLLRSAKSLAAWDERKYESAAAAIFSARN